MRTRLLTNSVLGWAMPALPALLCLVLCSCSGEEDLSSSTGGSADVLTFSVSADDYATRGIPLNSLSGQAGLLGFAYDTETGWDNGQAPTMMYNEVMQGSGTTWQTSTTYVPDKTKTMRFYAYYPYQPYVAMVEDPETGAESYPVDAEGNEVEPIILMSGQEEVGVPYFEYTSPLTAEAQEDLMYAVSDEVNVNIETSKLDAVTLQFHHLLSGLTFTFTNGFDNGFIKKVVLDNICYKGQFSFDTKQWTIEEDVEEISQDVEVKVTTADTDVKPLLGETQYFMLLPQTLNENSELKVVYNNGVKDYTLTFPLGEARVNGEPLEFKIGKITTLNIGVESLTKMVLKCSVTDWGHGATFNGADSDYPDVLLEHDVDSWQPDLGLDAQNDTIEHVIVTGPQTTAP